MKYKVVIFDLDGTLLDTLGDLTESVNTLLNRYSFPTHSKEKVSTFIGHGAPYLLKKSLPFEHQEESKSFMSEFIEIYEHQHSLTYLYDGIETVLDYLVAKGVKLALFTNKPEKPTIACLKTYLHKWDFTPAIAQTANMPVKPDPHGIKTILEAHTCSPDEALYIGDSEVDILTAHNAKMLCVSAAWGFRTASQLSKAHADIILDTPFDLIDYFQEVFGNY